METKEEAILKVTEEMIRRGGYNGFSFRNVAQEVGVKSSSVHYYFPTKEDLGIAVAKYYTDRFIAFLQTPAELSNKGVDPITHYVSAFRHALTQDKRMCLCGLLGAEIDGLPDGVVSQTKIFFNRNLEWLEDTYSFKGHDAPAIKAMQVLSILEGAMIISNALNSVDRFDQAVAFLSE